ncbi:MAG: TonB-dependent receptor [Rhodospirillaceae bacterium]|nr:TonB-dependent receptor [Rhodospirillaceae bacterium]
MSVISLEQIDKSGIVTVETLLQRLPASAGFAGNQTSAYWATRGWGTTQVNLRGLGINRTLVLLDGRRLVNGGTGANSSPDLSMIPTSLIGRMEVLKDGASAIYGADAVAGVVNIITRDDLEGLKMSARYGVTEEGDGDDITLDLSYGVRSDAGGISFAASYQDASAVNMASRAPCSLGESAGALICVGSGATAGGRAALPNGQIINFTTGNAFELFNVARHGYQGNEFLNAVNPIKRLNTALLADYEITPEIEAFGQFLYTRRETDQIATPGTLTGATIPAFAIAANHPTNPTGQNISLIQRRLVEGGPRFSFQDTDTYQAVAGLRGNIGDRWNWEAAVDYGNNSGVDGFTNVANKQNVANTLNTALCSNAPNAAIPCADYLGAGDVTPRVLNYILTTIRDNGGNETLNLNADIVGPLFELPAGSLQMAAGVAYRRDEGSRFPDNLTVLGIANTNQQTPIVGQVKATEAYAEASVPLLRDVPAVEMLEFNAAIRYSDYDRFGSDTNYKLSGDWAVGLGLRVRSTYGTAFRVPSVAELFGGVSEGNLTTTDPCSRYSTSTNATLVANCRASGVPAGYIQPNNTVLTRTGGNIALTPESAKTFTVGAVLEPPAAPGLALTVDYYRIKIDEAVRAIPGSTKLAVCYASANLSHPFCSPTNFTRNALTGEINFLSSQPVNVGSETASGIDMAVRYGFELMGRQATIDTSVTYLKKYEIIPFPTAAPIIFDGFIGGGNGGYPHWRGIASFSVDDPNWSATYSVQWIGKATDFNAAPTNIGYRAPNVFYHNAQFAYQLTEQALLAVGIDNLFDKKAPYIRSWTDANTDTMTYDLLGRRGYVRITYDF